MISLNILNVFAFVRGRIFDFNFEIPHLEYIRTTCLPFHSNFLPIHKPQKEKNHRDFGGLIGRPEDNVFEPTELSVGRAYKVQWKKAKPDYYELARLYWVQGLTQRQVADLTGVRRTRIGAAAKKFKSLFENGAG